MTAARAIDKIHVSSDCLRDYLANSSSACISKIIANRSFVEITHNKILILIKQHMCLSHMIALNTG